MATRVPRTRVRDGELLDGEEEWVALYEFFKSHGYLLRKRYRPGWKAHWKPRQSILEIEEAIVPWRRNMLDAQRIADGQWVVFKHVPKTDPEIEIGRYLASDDLRADTRNHSVPLLDVLQPEADPDNAILVLPLLRRVDEPAPASMTEFLDLVDQTLEGLVFLHENQIAHRDCNWLNIMMKGDKMFPKGFHPQAPSSYPDGTSFPISFAPSRTADGGVFYYFIDFGISTLGESMTSGLDGQVRAPELSDVVPYDPYKLDVYILGTAYQLLLTESHIEDSFLLPLINAMTVAPPDERPTAAEALSKFRNMRAGTVHDVSLQAPPPPREESHMMGFILTGLRTFWSFWWSVRV